MRGYDNRSYGDGFADVYDEWYADVTDVGATVTLMAELAGAGGRVLELGVGTGRLAVPMAALGLQVVGLDSSEAMLDKLAERDRDGSVRRIRGDMVDDIPPGPFDGVLIAYNTIFNLLGDGDQQRLFDRVAERLAPDGVFVVEAVVPDDEIAPAGGSVSLRSMTTGRVVLSVTLNRPDEQRAEGQFIELSESAGVRLRPWSIRWASPGQLDEMAARAGLVLDRRQAAMDGARFTDDSAQHVSIYRKRTAT